ncbi:hypothetical protein CJ010_10980 [Azoarcus sp. DD4]|uniref:CopD family protein n=1 Tax=Azoarcus sp. DD4 TaxID=2027405 RepID=UPI001128F9E0|nr:CopD family protein [Azoarcus sp. DD4]QDF97013.1 hypothetical protein CJ010_10980 [Azoarcus sp. DD4]
MIEVVGAVAHWIQLAANMVLVGSSFFLGFIGYDNERCTNPWLGRLERVLPCLGAVVLLGLIGVVSTSTARITADVTAAWQPDAWIGVMRDTRVGQVWAIRGGLALVVMVAAVYVRRARARSWNYFACGGLAGVALAFSSFAGHAAADDSPWLTIPPHTLHLLAASLWFGSLPAFLASASGGAGAAEAEKCFSIRALNRFSMVALPIMIVVVVSGIVVAYYQVAPAFGGLVATRYGWLLHGKLALLIAILAIAARARFRWLPGLSGNCEIEEAQCARRLRTWVGVEVGCATLLLLVASVLAATVPAKHEGIDAWPYPFRFSIAATWDEPGTRTLVLVGGALLIAGGVAALVGRRQRWRRSAVVGAAVAFVLPGTALPLYAIATPASEYTYRPSTVPFDAISISRGSALFEANCEQCHGPQGMGNGPLAKSLRKPPIDLLTEPHTARHTAGDFFNWITTGFPDSGMPAFGDRFSEDDRWDLVNFIHALSRGYQSRPLGAAVIPDKPAATLGAPDFSFVSYKGEQGTLKDHREREAVLLVFFSWPESKDRLDQLAATYRSIRARSAQVIAVPWKGAASAVDQLAGYPYPIVADGARGIGRTYEAFRRTLSDPDLFGRGKRPGHMELLVDRFGYLRARWIPDQDVRGWRDGAMLAEQLERLRAERQILPPAEEHVH